MNDTTKPSEYLGYWGEKYKNDLLTDILPFWLKYGIDHENGGSLRVTRAMLKKRSSCSNRFSITKTHRAH